jgi:uncharacterized protein (DUF2267 family)
MMTSNDFISHVADHAGASADRAGHATRAVLAGIGSYLSASHRQLIADELPPALAAALFTDHGIGTPIAERVLAPGITAGRARELIASVCRVFAEELSAEAVRALRGCLPPDLASLLDPAPPERIAHTALGERRETLAGGRPGSRQPASESSAQRTQTESITAENPHAATKLSSTTGSTQERRRETLAEGRPGSARSIADARR